MNSEIISKNILKLRKKNKLTQAEFASILNVTPQAVSKWENSRGIPDIEILNIISQKFNIDMDELIKGKKKRLNKKYIYVFIIAIILILFALVYTIVNNQSTFNFNTLSSNNENFDITGVAAYSKDKKSIYISNIIYKKDDENKYVSMECSLYEEHDNNEEQISKCESSINLTNTYTLSELLKDITFNVDDYSSSCKHLNSNNLYLLIKATSTDDRLITYKIPLEMNGSC